MKKAKKYWPYYVMMLPGLIYILVNNYFPMFGLAIAFKKVNYSVGIWKSEWVGLGNFKYLFATKDIWKIIRNTIGYNAIFIVLGTFIAVAVALLISEIRNEFTKKLYQTIILIPHMISIVIVSYLVYGLLSTDAGLINNSILEPLGLNKISFYTTPKLWPFILTIVYIWKHFGYNCIIYYAAIISIDRSLYESAVIDGAGRWQQIKSITLPCMKLTIVTMVLLSVGRIFYSDFGLFYQVPMNNGMLLDVTNTIDTYVYRGLMQLNDVGRSSAAGFFQSIIGFIVVFSANALVKKIDKESALF